MSDPFVLPLSACRDCRLVGGKAAGLASLIHQGFRVPQGICLTTAAYEAVLCAIGIDAARLWSSAKVSTAEERRRLLCEVMTRISDSPLPHPVEAALWAAVERQHLSPEPLWAVRSSAKTEYAGVSPVSIKRPWGYGGPLCRGPWRPAGHHCGESRRSWGCSEWRRIYRPRKWRSGGSP